MVVHVRVEGELDEAGARIHFSLTGLPESEAGSPIIWADPMRHLGTFAMDLITFTGFALILVAGFAIASRFGHQITQTSGLIWGFAGFAAVHLSLSFLPSCRFRRTSLCIHRVCLFALQHHL